MKTPNCSWNSQQYPCCLYQKRCTGSQPHAAARRIGQWIEPLWANFTFVDDSMGSSYESVGMMTFPTYWKVIIQMFQSPGDMVVKSSIYWLWKQPRDSKLINQPLTESELVMGRYNQPTHSKPTNRNLDTVLPTLNI